MSNFYKILNVDESASQDEIRKSFRKLSLKYHPDRNNSYDSENIFKELNEAYEVLGNDKKRNEYDKLHLKNNINNSELSSQGLQKFFGNYTSFFKNFTPKHMNNNSDICDDNMEKFLHQINDETVKVMNDVIQNLQNNNTAFDRTNCNIFGFPSRQHIAHMNINSIPISIEKININHDITLEEIFNGTTISINYIRTIFINNQESQETIHKSIYIEPGKDTKIPIILDNQGHQRDNYFGNVEITLNELSHTVYKRNDLHLLMEKTISLKEALTGFSITFQHINDKQYTLQNKEQIICPNSQREIAHLGLTNKNSKGSLFIIFNVEFPDILNDTQKEQLKTIL